jgi:1-deoxy-D-xylulose-5-phosphate reductoisomerase
LTVLCLIPSLSLLFLPLFSKMKNIAILGSTGSIGVQTLQVVKKYPDKFKVSYLAGYSNKELLLSQQKEFNVPKIGLIDKTRYSDDKITYGEDCLLEALEGADTVVVATRGIVALKAVLAAIKKGIDVALANKEVLVTAGQLIKEQLKNSKSTLLPIDSEHSAVFQCINGQNKQVKKIILTASGGPFFGYSHNQLKTITAKEALNHPKWRMGEKITIDSATLINKGFEVIEASWLFDIPIEKIETVIHPQSAVHSMVEFVDGSILAQLAVADMRLPISYALFFPYRAANAVESLNLTQLSRLEFFPVDNTVFEGIDICVNAFKQDRLMPTVLSACDEVLVDAFIKGKISFDQIYCYIKKICNHYKNRLLCINFDVANIVALDAEVKKFTAAIIEANQ